MTPSRRSSTVTSKGSAAQVVGEHAEGVLFDAQGVRQRCGGRFHHHLFGQFHVEAGLLGGFARFLHLHRGRNRPDA